MPRRLGHQKKTGYPPSQNEMGKKDGLNLSGGGDTPCCHVLAWGHGGAGVPPSLPTLPPLAFTCTPEPGHTVARRRGQRHPARLGPAWPARRGAAGVGDAGTLRSLPPELRHIASPPAAHAGTHGCAQSPAGCRAGSEEGEGKSSLCNFTTVFTAGRARMSPESHVGPFPTALALRGDSHHPPPPPKPASPSPYACRHPRC